MLLELDCRPKPKIDKALLSILNKGACGNALLEATLRSSCSIDQALLSLSSGTSYGKEPIHENTIEQILGNIEKSHLGGLKDHSNDSYDQSKRFRREIEAKLFGSRRGQVAQKFANGANFYSKGGNSNINIQGI